MKTKYTRDELREHLLDERLNPSTIDNFIDFLFGKEIMEEENTVEEKTTPSNFHRPPLGCIPEILYKEQRLKDLARAINGYISGGFIGSDYAVTIGIWCDELSRRLKENDK